MTRFEDTLKERRISYSVNNIRDKRKYFIDSGALGTKINNIINNVKELSQLMEDNEYAVLPVAKQQPFTIEIVFNKSSIRWRIVKGVDSVDITDKTDIEALERLLNALKKVI
ncbi:hypothetical protein SBFV3_gp08 [Sulfolobales Beppu filamentous virus 3]|uniref:Uncharacterized protein n=1 Tax=Sulfolobales Beppu filamentous virus 3 TaxID=2493124 RepID=A0A3S8NF10_9VIRU|nr:hypothetical protein HOU83_gp08 [Sulfolobales Beppu filamentous virus 3]AZI75843.1 hypothetical protein SBFV3_gp08 [Sulfolobales Beppu filamentous virus 3]